MCGTKRISQIFDEVGDIVFGEIIRKEQAENYKNNPDETGYLETLIQISTRFGFAECEGANKLFFMARTDIQTNETSYVLMYGKQQNFGFKKLMEKQFSDYYEALNSFEMSNNMVYQVMLEKEKELETMKKDFSMQRVKDSLSDTQKVLSGLAEKRFGEVMEDKAIWKPEKGDTFYFVGRDGSIGSYGWTDSTIDYVFYAYGNCFKSEEEAKSQRDRIKEKLVSTYDSGKSE